MHELSDFSSIFEIATALCIAYGFIKTAYQFPLNLIDKELSIAKEALANFQENDKKPSLKPFIVLLEQQYLIKKVTYEPYYLFLSRLSIALACIPIITLIYAGFTEETFSTIFIFAILILNLAPLPTLSILAFFKSLDLLEELKTPRNLLRTELDKVLNRI